MQYARWEELRNWRIALWHWRINPGLVVNEILLGQRVPRNMFVPVGSRVFAPSRRTFVRCERCGVVRCGLRWSGSSAFGNWFGIFCDRCGAEHAAIRNGLSVALAFVCAP